MKMLNHFLMLLLIGATACGGGGDEQEETPKAPAVPGGVVLHSSTTTSLSFQWNAADGATGYEWKLLQGLTEIKTGSGTNRNAVIKDLTPGTTYKFAVRSLSGEMKSAFSSFLEASTDEEETPPDPGPGPDPGPSSIDYEEFGIPASEEDGVVRAFPGAEGGGMYTTGGRGGKVIHVTNLKDNGTGSLRAAINESGARTIVFDVAGVIELQSDLNISKDNITIAGQTAPGDGICLKNYTFRISANNVIVRFIRCRMGDEKKTENDAMQILSHEDDKFSNIIIDHCSVSWSTDECASFYGMKDFTFQWNIVSESLRVSIHEKGTHGYGGIWGGANATYHHNLLAHHDSRNPRIDHDYVSTQKGPVSIFNNVVYNWSGNTCYGGESSSKNGSDYRKYNFFNNYYKPGPATPSNHIWLLEPTTSCNNCGGTILPGHFWMEGNFMYGKDWTSDNWTTSSVHASQDVIDAIRESQPYHTGQYQSVHSGEGCFGPVLSYAGASLRRDPIDSRIADEAKKGTFTYTGSKGGTKGLIDTQTDAGGWPEYKAAEEEIAKVTDTDKDGIPDWFEDKAGLGKADASDANAFSLDPGRRYTNLEMYLHYLVKDIVAAQNTGGTYKKL